MTRASCLVYIAAAFVAVAAAACSSSSKGAGFGDDGTRDGAADGATEGGMGDQTDATLGDFDGGGGPNDGSLFNDASLDVATEDASEVTPAPRPTLSAAPRGPSTSATPRRTRRLGRWASRSRC